MKLSKVYIFGNRKTCSHCRKIATVVEDAKFVAWLKANKATIVDCDKTANAKTYSSSIRVVGYKGGKLPQVFIMSDTGKMLGTFLARSTPSAPLTAASLIKKIEALCPDCCAGDCSDTPPTYKTCPTCGGKGEVLA